MVEKIYQRQFLEEDDFLPFSTEIVTSKFRFEKKKPSWKKVTNDDSSKETIFAIFKADIVFRGLEMSLKRCKTCVGIKTSYVEK